MSPLRQAGLILAALWAVLTGVLVLGWVNAHHGEKAALDRLEAAQTALSNVAKVKTVEKAVEAGHTTAVNVETKHKEKQDEALAQATQKSPDWANERVPASVLSVLRDD